MFWRYWHMRMCRETGDNTRGVPVWHVEVVHKPSFPASAPFMEPVDAGVGVTGDAGVSHPSVRG